MSKFTDGDAQRLLNVVSEQVDRRFSDSRGQSHWGKITAVDTSTSTCSAYIFGESAYASQGFIYPAWSVPVVNDIVRVFIDPRGDRFVEDIYSQKTLIRLGDEGDVDLSSTNHPFQIGYSTGSNLAIDSNEIQARNNGSAATLNLNVGGGTVFVGDTLSVSSTSVLTGDVAVGGSGAGNSANGIKLAASGSIELASSGGTPYIDFKDTLNIDFDARIIFNGTRLSLEGKTVSAPNGVYADGGVRTKSKAGTFSDTDFVGDVTADGLLGVDTTNDRIYFRQGGVWSYVAKTAGFEIPIDDGDGNDERICPDCNRKMRVGQTVIGRLNGRRQDGALHGIWVHQKCPS